MEISGHPGYIAGDIVRILSRQLEERARELVKLLKTKIVWIVYKRLRAARPAERGRCRIELAASTRW